MTPPGWQSAARDERWRGLISERLRKATGIAARPGSLPRLPPTFLRQSCLSPDEILTQLAVGPRTRNVLRRFLAREPAGGAWTYGRLLSIDRLGVATLLDVLEASRQRPSTRSGGAATRPDPQAVFCLAVRLIMVRLPASEKEIRERLARAHLSGFVIGLRWLEDFARMTGQALPLTVIRRDGLVVAVPAGLAPLAKTTLTLAARAVRVAGLASVRAIAERAGTSSLAFVRRLLEARAGLAWLDRSHDWFWFGNRAHRALLALAAGTGAGAGDHQGHGHHDPPASVHEALARQLLSATGPRG